MAYVVGIDEAGRGPLAGPVAVGLVCAATGFDIATEFPGAADSKQLTEKRREKVFAELERRSQLGDLQFRVELESAEVIDANGIAYAIRTALERGLAELVKNRECHVLLDGSLKAPGHYAQETIIGGDASVPIISLASIAAKVTRDRLMLELVRAYPEYGFERHKGYGTRAHYEALQKHGPCTIHRRTYIHLDS